MFKHKGKYNKLILLFLITLILALAMILLSLSNEVNLDEYNNNYDSTETIVDAQQLDDIISELNNSEIKHISNIENKQADVILDAIGVDIENIYSYAAVIDPRSESTDSIAVIRPKTENMDSVKGKMLDYIANKQLYIPDLTGFVRVYGEYVIMATGDKSLENIENIVLKLNKLGLVDEKV